MKSQKVNINGFLGLTGQPALPAYLVSSRPMRVHVSKNNKK